MPPPLALNPAGGGEETPPMSVVTVMMVTSGRVLVLVTGMGESLVTRSNHQFFTFSGSAVGVRVRVRDRVASARDIDPSTHNPPNMGTGHRWDKFIDTHRVA